MFSLSSRLGRSILIARTQRLLPPPKPPCQGGGSQQQLQAFWVLLRLASCSSVSQLAWSLEKARTLSTCTCVYIYRHTSRVIREVLSYLVPSVELFSCCLPVQYLQQLGRQLVCSLTPFPAIVFFCLFFQQGVNYYLEDQTHLLDVVC